MSKEKQKSKFIQQLNRLEEKLNLGKRKDYVVNKNMFRAVVIISVLLFGLCYYLDGKVVFSPHSKNWWVKPGQEQTLLDMNRSNMRNQLVDGYINPEAWKYKLDHPPSWITRNYWWVVLSLFGIALLLNKVIYNRNNSIFTKEDMDKFKEETKDV